MLVGALMLKEFNGLTDEEITASCCFNFRYQYALHTTSFEEQPVSTRTLSRFRTRLASYKLTTGTDLVHECFVKMADDIREYMDISPSIKRMDSMMVESNIRKMGRLELLYTCLSNLVKELHNDGREELKRQADESNLPVAFSISSGYAVHEPNSEDSIDMIISRADNEMYIQKAASHAARPDSI